MAKKVTKKSPTTKKVTKRKSQRTTVKAASAPVAQLTDEQIRLRAFEIYRSGRNPSDPDADWLQAVGELEAELVR